MRNLRNKRFGLLESTLIEFKQKGNSSIEEIKEYLIAKYQLTVSTSIIKKRLEGLAA